MIDRISKLLFQYNISHDKNKLLPITDGASGAYIFSVDEKYIVKYAHSPVLNSNNYSNNFDVSKNFQKEFDFYRLYGKDIDFIPEIVFQIADGDELLIVMKKYYSIKRDEWDENLQNRAIDVCACINAVDTTNFNEILQVNKESNDEPYPLTLSYENWVKLHNKYPAYVDFTLLNKMYENFNETDIYAKNIEIPETLCHGDFHPGNFLRNGEKLLVCDWQNTYIGKGIGDVVFFISRGADNGIIINRNNLIEAYHKALLKYTNIKVDINSFYKYIAVCEFSVSFRFWAEYLQDSSIDRILKIYDAMVNSYNYIISH